ncbi:MAG TPA: adenosine kinase [Acidimicrobiales bacterium]|nr:adenosine kinase [Acidimicrobiales bacterium]
MPGDALDVTAVGHAIVDVIAPATEEDLELHGLVKGSMILVDADQVEATYAAMGPAVESSGGSAANTVAGVASFGGAAAFVGKVRDDQLGRVFTHDIRSIGVEFSTPPATEGEATALCLVMVTTDAQRTMTTYLGAARRLAAEDIDRDLVTRSQITYLEGYLWDPPDAISALVQAMAWAHDAGQRVAFTLSDPFCVDRHRQEFLGLLAAGSIDVLFANEVEALSLFDVTSLDEVLSAARGTCEIVAITRGPAGSVVVADGDVVEVPAEPVDEVVDTTGAGDLYAAGFLFGLTHAADLEMCARLGSVAAAEVISHVGARPQTSLAALAVPIFRHP